jgi:NADPH:quinone reductase-like Zn-dependent oxidoreductase
VYPAFHSVDSCDLKPGQWLAVIGCGGLGQLATQYAKAFGFQVIGLDISDPNLAVTKEQGADHVFNTLSDKDYVQKIKDLTSGGVHAAAIFSNADAAYASAPSIIRLGGTLMVVGSSANPRVLYFLSSISPSSPLKLVSSPAKAIPLTQPTNTKPNQTRHTQKPPPNLRHGPRNRPFQDQSRKYQHSSTDGQSDCFYR